jgi:hypothetical protein
MRSHSRTKNTPGSLSQRKEVISDEEEEDEEEADVLI